MNRSKAITISGLLLGVIAVPLLYAGVKKLASFDPFSKFTGKWSDPFGNNIGSVMDNVDIGVYEKGLPVVTFRTNRLTIRRDKQFLQLQSVSNGKIYEKGKPTANFYAGLASYDRAKEQVNVSRGATLAAADYTLQTAALVLDRGTKTIKAESGVSGTYKNGTLSAATFRLDFGGRKASATNIVWKGKVRFQNKTQDTRDVQIRSPRFEQTSESVYVYYDAEASDRDSIMRAKKITWDQKDDVITLEGSCEYYGPDAIISAPKVVVYHKEKRAVATGEVRMFVKPQKQKGVLAAEPIPPAQPVLPPGMKQPLGAEDTLKKQQQEIDDELRSGKSFRKYPVIVTCNKIEYTYSKGNKKAIISGSPRARQQLRAGSWRELTAPKAIYEEEKELLTLLSEVGGRDVKMTNSAGDSFTAEKLEISTVEGQERLSGTRLEGVIKVKEESSGSPPPRK